MKLGVPQKAALQYCYSALVLKIFLKIAMKGFTFRRVACLKLVILLKN